MEEKIKHLEMMQGVVNRLSTNSFLLKGWSVVLVSALFALSAPSHNQSFIFLAYIPAFVFWGLDGYFLWQERLYRKLYDKVRKTNGDGSDFSMDTRDFISGNPLGEWFDVVFSKTLVAFHGVLIAAIIIVMLIQIAN